VGAIVSDGIEARLRVFVRGDEQRREGGSKFGGNQEK